MATAPETGLLASDADQTAADADQTAADADQTASDTDQSASEADQHAADRDQAASDRDLAENPALASLLRTHEVSRADRELAAFERETTTLVRSRISAERDTTAEERDEQARKRDAAADARDRLAETLELEAEHPRETSTSTDNRLRLALIDSAAARTRAAAERVRAAADRERAANDRAQARTDREQANAELVRAHLDHLTGAYTRGMGEQAIRNEMIRARRAGGDLVLAFVDVDGLKSVNEREGYEAGDDLVRNVAATLRSKLRPYDPLVRVGGDEFVCTISDTDIEGARVRIQSIQRSLDSGSISVGLATMRDGDSLSDLIRRADQEMRRARPRADPSAGVPG